MKVVIEDVSLAPRHGCIGRKLARASKVLVLAVHDVNEWVDGASCVEDTTLSASHNAFPLRMRLSGVVGRDKVCDIAVMVAYPLRVSA